MHQIFEKRFKPKKIINNPSYEDLKCRSLEKGGVLTEFGNLAVVTKVRNRSAKFTEVIVGEIDAGKKKLIDEVLEHLRGKEMIQLDRVMCQAEGFKKHCRVYIDAEYPRIPYIWGNTLFPAEEGEPDFVTIDVPDWPERKVLVFPESGTTLALGTDYFGEVKKSMLRQVMYANKLKGHLGLHAASKIMRVKRRGKMEEFGFLLFGLSGTGKTSLSCYSHWLKHPERVVIRQDDVNILLKDGSAIGTEESFYLKTDALDTNMQPLLYAAVISPRAILENVWVNAETSKVDFFDSTLTSNGRGMVKRGDIAFTDDDIDLRKVDFIIFITRRFDVAPPLARLSPEWGAAAFMLGESIETSAGDPSQAGKSLRVVGTNPFIVGSEEEEGNIFLRIIRQNPDIQCFVINTGKIGGKEKGEKITVFDSVKMLEMVARDEITWKKDDFWGYDVPTDVPGVDMGRFDLNRFYSTKEITELTNNLKKERLEWLARFPGLSSDVTRALNH